MDIFRAAHGWGAKKPPLLKIYDTSYNDETWNSSYTLPREDSKYMNHVTHPLSSADISIFSLEISKFCYIKK